MVVYSFSCSGISTGDLNHSNPIYNVSILGTHKPALGNPLPALSQSRRVARNLNLKRRGDPGSGCQASSFAKKLIARWPACATFEP
jgi:hypothetical protein